MWYLDSGSNLKKTEEAKVYVEKIKDFNTKVFKIASPLSYGFQIVLIQISKFKQT